MGMVAAAVCAVPLGAEPRWVSLFRYLATACGSLHWMFTRVREFVWLLGLILAACGGPADPQPWPTEFPPNPEDGAHFDGVRDPYYEGWYHKISLPEKHEAFFFIYTVVNPAPDSAYPAEAFLYCGQASSLETVYQPFPVDAYRAQAGYRDVRIGETARATALRFAGEAEDAGGSCRWDVWLTHNLAWTETMGWLTGQAGLETSWTVGSLRAEAAGWIEFNGERFTFDGVPAYGDHNWGSVFPRQWFWLQANDFPSGEAALAASGGTVQFGDTELEAEMIGLWLDGTHHTFRTQDLDQVEAQSAKGAWTIRAEKDLERITVEAACVADEMFHLLAPTPDGVQPRAWESLLGSVDVRFEQRDQPDGTWRVVFEETSANAGVEVGLEP